MKEARKGHLARMAKLLDAGVDVDARGKFGQTALMQAVFSGQTEAVRYLLGRGADPRLVSDDGAGPLFFACVRGDSEIADLLIRHGADVNEVRRTVCSPGDVHYTTPLDVARSGGHAAVVVLLRDAGAYPGRREQR